MRFLLNVLFSVLLSVAIVRGQDNVTQESAEDRLQDGSDEVLRSDTTPDEGGFSVDEEKLILDPDTSLDPDEPDDSSAVMEGTEQSELSALDDADGEVLINDPDTGFSPNELENVDEEDITSLPGVTLGSPEEEEASLEEAFGTVDEDGDGSVSFAELLPAGTDEDMKQKLQKGFNKSDKNGDGLLHRDEFPTLLQFLDDDEEMYANPDEVLKEMDTDKDGKVSLLDLMPSGTDPKMKGRLEKGFKLSDKNGDGFIHRDEILGLMRYFEQGHDF